MTASTVNRDLSSYAGIDVYPQEGTLPALYIETLNSLKKFCLYVALHPKLDGIED